MGMRRAVFGVVAGTALLGVPVLTAGVASAHGSPATGAGSTCTETGTATGSPGVSSGNVTQVPTLNCSHVTGPTSLSLNGPFVEAPAGAS